MSCKSINQSTMSTTQPRHVNQPMESLNL